MTPSAGPPPDDLPLVLDRGVRVLARGRVLVGGDPPRIVRLRRAVRVWSVPRTSDGERRLARQLLDRGLLHPRPDPVPEVPDVTVVVPVRDRPEALSRCLAALDRQAPVVVVDDASSDGERTRQVCGAWGARLVRLDTNVGPAAARDAGLAVVSTPFVAFLDSDCLPTADWLVRLRGHFLDTAVGAVAPRVRPARSGTLLGRYTAARCPLDLGPRQAAVRPGARVPYVPTAALLVRRAALPVPAFDPGLRYGEDVDLVWRLHDRGWSVRYDPDVVVVHEEPDTWSAWLSRRHAYGTSAGPLGLRHGARLAPLALSQEQVGAVVLLLAGAPLAAVGVLLLPAARLYRSLVMAGVPGREGVAVAAELAASGLRRAVTGLGEGGAVVTLPVLLAGACLRRTRPVSVAGLLLPPLLGWLGQRPALDAARWTVLRLVEDLAYASGVWRGCARARSLAALRPRVP